jgi:O-antigen ligase
MISLLPTNMRTGREKVNDAVDAPAPSIAEAAVLLALAAIPSLVLPFGQNPFEPHKAALLWVLLSAAIASGFAVAVRMATLPSQPWTKRLTLAATATAALLTVSFALSPSTARALAWWGSGLRRDGAFTELALVGAAVAVAVLAAAPSRFERIVAAVALGSVAPTIYGLSQWLGVDPLRADARLWDRPGGTFGNPLWLSGYLVVVIPMTIAFAVRASGASRRGGAALAAGQIGALMAARSRGPFLAIAAAAAIGGALLLASRRRRLLAVTLAAATAIASVAAIAIVPLVVRSDALVRADAQTPDDRSRATVAIRALLWRAAGRAIDASPARLLFGSGPESMPRVLAGYAGASAHALEGPEEVPDRAHNDALDRLVMFGAAGLAARVLTFCVALAAALAAAGLLVPADSTRFALRAAAAVGAAIAVGFVVDGAWTLAISVPAALVLVPCLGIVWRRGDPVPAAGRRGLWAAAATAAVIAHAIDLHTSIASIASALIGAAALGLAVAAADRPTATDRSTRKEPDLRDPALDDGMAVLAGFASFLAFVALTPTSGATLAAWATSAATLLVGHILVRSRARGLAISTVVAIVPAFLWIPLSDAAAPPDVQSRALVDHVSMLAAVVAAAVGALAWRLSRETHGHAASTAGTIGAAIAVAAVGSAAIHTSTIDVVLGAAAACEATADLTCARGQYAVALGIDSTDARALTRQARTLAAQADSSAGTESRDRLFEDAARLLRRAREADPYDYHHPRNQAALERLWTRRLRLTDRAQHLDRADEAYGAAIARAPLAGALWLERANLQLERSRPEDAMRMLERALALGADGHATRLVCDAALGALAVDDHAGAAVEALRVRGLERLSSLYATPAADGDVIRR